MLRLVSILYTMAIMAIFIPNKKFFVLQFIDVLGLELILYTI